jgi:hypothetical protein
MWSFKSLFRYYKTTKARGEITLVGLIILYINFRTRPLVYIIRRSHVKSITQLALRMARDSALQCVMILFARDR